MAGQGGGSRVLAGLGGLLGMKTTGDLFVGVLGSETVQDDLIAKFNLRKVYGKKLWKDARKKLTSRTDLSVDKKSEIIQISVEDRSPQRAAAMAREYVDELNRLMATLNTSASHRERIFLQAQLQQAKQNLENSEKQFSQFASANEALDVPAQGRAMLDASSQLQGQLIATQTELQGLRQIYTDNNLRVRETQARIDELQRQLQKLKGDSSPSTENTSDPSEMLSYPSIRRLPQLGVTYADLMRTTKINEAIFEALTQQYEAAKIAEAKDLPSIKVLDEPRIPEEKSFPPRAVITIVGGLLTLGIGIAWILGREHWKHVDPADPGKSFITRVTADLKRDLPLLGHRGASRARWNAWQPGASNGARDRREAPHPGGNGNANG
jgi:capsule polysaccharide export protein KpsE/RkpR